MSKMVTLMTSDNQTFEVKEEVAVQSETIKNLINDGCADDENSAIPLPNVTGATLSMIIEYCKKHAAAADEDLAAWDKDFVKVGQAKLYDLIMGANYLNIDGLLHLIAQTVADMCKGKKPEEIRKIFNIKNDFSPAEEEAIRKENQWAFD